MERVLRNTDLWPASSFNILCFNILLTFIFNCFLVSLEHIQFTNILFIKGMHQSWAHIPSQQQQSQSLIEVSDASYYYSVFSCLCVTTANQSATLEAHIHLTPHCDLSQTHFFSWVSYWKPSLHSLLPYVPAYTLWDTNI